MPFRVKASAIAVSAAICTLLAPAAMASAGVSHAPVQVTGKKLKSGLLPPTRFQPSYSTIFASKSGKAPILEIFSQSVYQSASNHAATMLNGQISAKYKKCKSVSFSDGHG